MRMLVDRLMQKSVLRSGLDPEDAASILWAVSSIEMYRKLVTYSGWTPDHYEGWVGRHVKAADPGGLRRESRLAIMG